MKRNYDEIAEDYKSSGMNFWKYISQFDSEHPDQPLDRNAFRRAIQRLKAKQKFALQQQAELETAGETLVPLTASRAEDDYVRVIDLTAAASNSIAKPGYQESRTERQQVCIDVSGGIQIRFFSRDAPASVARVMQLYMGGLP